MLRQAMLCALQQDDEDQVLRLLDTGNVLALESVIRFSWLPLAEELARDRSVIDGDGRLELQLRQRIRNVSLLETDLPITYMLVPAKRTILPAACLAALVLTRRGTLAHVWRWPMPPQGTILTVGDEADRLAGDGHLPIHGETLRWPSLAALVM
jgi:hypothetical protein